MNDEWQDSDDALISAGRKALRELVDAPPAALRRAERLQGRGAGLLMRARAILAFDSWGAGVPALRAGDTRTRQFLFASDLRDIDVRIEAAADGWTLEGQVLGPTDDGSLVLRREGHWVRDVALDEMGTFRVTGLPPGVYQAMLYFATDSLELPTLDIGFSAS